MKKEDSRSLLSVREWTETKQIEMFGDSLCHHRKPRSNYRRPSSLGFSTMPIRAKSEAKLQFQPKPATRSHIVAKTPDHLKLEGKFESSQSEVRASYRNMSPARPQIRRIYDTLRPEGDFNLKTETRVQYENKKPQRPTIHKLKDHHEQVQPKGAMIIDSEYKKSFATAQKGERAAPVWITKFEKVTIDGDTSRQ